MTHCFEELEACARVHHWASFSILKWILLNLIYFASSTADTNVNLVDRIYLNRQAFIPLFIVEFNAH